jgi:hypothetical protein
MRKGTGMAAVVWLTLAAAAGFAAPAAAATPTCFGATCNGKDVNTTNCATGAFAIDGFKTTSGSTTDMTIDLWYSPVCHAMWGEFRSFIGGGVSTSLRAVAPYSGSGTSRLLSQAFVNGITGYSTPLYDWQQSIKFCWSQNPGDPGDDSQRTAVGGCTRWR